MTREDNELLSTRQKLLLGGLGGIAPVIINLIVIDLETLLLDLTILSGVSYCIRVMALFAVGATVAVLNKSEHDRFKVFQLGIAAPALITAVINGSHVTIPEKPGAEHARYGAVQSALSFELIASVQAQTETKGPKQFSLPRETAMQQITRGFLGTTPSNLWFVIAGSQRDLAEAERQAAQYRAKGFAADVYAPYGNNPYYAVVIGSQLDRTEAQRLRLKAIEAGLPRDTYLWTFPRR